MFGSKPAPAQGPGLTDEQKGALFRDGFVHLPAAVPQPLVEDALRAINLDLGSEGMAKADLPGFRAKTFTPSLVRSDAIKSLYFGSSLPALVESAIGPGRVRAPSEGQVALRFPTAAPGSKAVPHIDGVYAPNNGVRQGTLYHFTGLIGIFLSDVLAPDRGNFTVWPGSHHTLQELVRSQGVASVATSFPSIALPPAHQVIARAGDAVFAHYQLAHGISPNLGPHVRYAIFFRLFHASHDSHDTAPLADIWREWEGMRAFAP